eukprot:scaffold1305_cov19-Tisochrysis_lutea.AAC.1
MGSRSSSKSAAPFAPQIWLWITAEALGRALSKRGAESCRCSGVHTVFSMMSTSSLSLASGSVVLPVTQQTRLTMCNAAAVCCDACALCFGGREGG